jgi:hypothetical protein
LLRGAGRAAIRTAQRRDYGERPDSDRAIDGGAKWHGRIRDVYTDELLACDD